MTDLTPLIVAALAFGAIASVAFVAGQIYVRSAQLDRRLPLLQGAAGDVGSAGSAVAGLVARHFDAKRFGIDDTLRGRLRLNLVRAGYFRRDAINFYVFWRLAAAALTPILAYLLLGIAIDSSPLVTSVFVIVGLGMGVIAPDAFISRRQRLLSAEYRNVFPDFLDLLVVCVDAGLSVEGALDRITAEVTKRSRSFGINLAIMAAEMRAGRAFVEALETLASRLMIPEAQSLVAVLRQSSELGSDVSGALGVFGDELRDKRLFRAEEEAGKLSVKMLVPLTLFIFPLVLMVIALPLVVSMVNVFLPILNAAGR